MLEKYNIILQASVRYCMLGIDAWCTIPFSLPNFQGVQ
jgi:hypothetical protein